MRMKSNSSTPRPSRRPMTAPSPRRSRAPAPRSSCSPAASSTARCRRPRATGSRSASTAAAPPAASTPAAALPFKAAEHLPTCCASAATRRRRRRPLPVADPAGARRAPAAADAPAGDDRPLHPAAATRAAARSPPPAASSAAWTRSSPTPSTAPRRLRDEVGLDPARVRVIPHGAFDYLTRLPEEKPLPAELEGAEGPVILFFGLLRPYKGIEVLLEAFRRLERRRALDRRQPADGRRAAARAGRRRRPGRVRFVTRFVEDAEIPAIFRRADLVALPYLDAEHSGVLYTGLAFGKPLVLSAVGGFPEVAATGAARLVPPGDADGARRRPGRAGRRRGRPRRAGRRRPRRRRRSLLLGRGRPPHPRPLPRADRGAPMTTVAAVLFWLCAGLIVYTHARLPAGAAGADRACGASVRRLAARSATAPMRRAEQPPTVSLIVPAYDEEEVIAAKVANALALDYPRERLQVIVASDGSADATAERARAAGADLVLELPPGGKVAALNAAAEQADRRAARLLRRQQRLGAGRPAPPGRALRRPRRRLRLRPGPLPRPRAATTSRAPTGATRWRCGRWSRRWPGSPPATAPSTRSAAMPTCRSPPSGSHDLSFPFLLAKRGLRSLYAPGAPRRGEDGADDRGRVRPQTADDGRPLGHRRRRRHALPARLLAALRLRARLPPAASLPQPAAARPRPRSPTWPCSATAGSTP